MTSGFRFYRTENIGVPQRLYSLSRRLASRPGTAGEAGQTSAWSVAGFPSRQNYRLLSPIHAQEPPTSSPTGRRRSLWQRAKRLRYGVTIGKTAALLSRLTGRSTALQGAMAIPRGRRDEHHSVHYERAKKTKNTETFDAQERFCTIGGESCVHADESSSPCMCGAKNENRNGRGVVRVQTDLDKLKTAFGDALPLPPDVNYDEIAYGKMDGWDSVAHMALIAQIESIFDVMLDTDDVVGLNSFSKSKEILTRYGVKFD
jgi:acyl carrier protein